ncbi:hypothetical protein ACOSQ3_004874 [Xanthoceras sorbifolium]
MMLREPKSSKKLGSPGRGQASWAQGAGERARHRGRAGSRGQASERSRGPASVAQGASKLGEGARWA